MIPAPCSCAVCGSSRLAKLGEDVARRFDDKGTLGRAIFMFNCFGRHWRDPQSAALAGLVPCAVSGMMIPLLLVSWVIALTMTRSPSGRTFLVLAILDSS